MQWLERNTWIVVAVILLAGIIVTSAIQLNW